MATKFYKVYTASQYDGLDFGLYETNHRWNLERTEVILEFKVGHDDSEGVLTRQQAADYMNNEQWTLPD